MEHHKRVSIKTPPQSEACIMFSVNLCDDLIHWGAWAIVARLVLLMSDSITLLHELFFSVVTKISKISLFNQYGYGGIAQWRLTIDSQTHDFTSGGV